MAEVAFTCPQCGHIYQFAVHLAGKRGRCKTCQAIFRIPAPSPAAPTVLALATVTVSRESTPYPLPSLTGPSAEDKKITFRCPTCGHGYRLDAKVAGKWVRCTTCRGVFTVPAQSVPAAGNRAASSQRRAAEADRPPRTVATDADPARGRTRPDTSRPGPPAAPGAGGRTPVAAQPEAGDSGWWELDSSESIPATTVRGGARHPRTPTAVATAAHSPAGWTRSEDDGPIVTATPVRPRWVLYASIAAGAIVGGIAYAVTYSLVSNAFRPASPPVVDQPAPTTPPPAVADAAGPKSSPPHSLQPAGAAERHREAVDALIRAYNEIADGYARIRDAGSIPAGNGTISRGVAQLRSAAHRGKSLPPLSPSERQALVRQTGPTLLEAVDRVLGELRRLRATPGLRSDFDRLIATYARTREEIQKEVDQP
jgi:transcription elongation factor Elf1